MKITIEATTEELKELLPTIASSQGQNETIERLKQTIHVLESKIIHLESK